MQINSKVNKPETFHFLFFIEDLSTDPLFLDHAETRHAVTVLRMRPGDFLHLTDGRGGAAVGKFINVKDGQMELSIVERTGKVRSGPYIDLYVGLPDRDAFERLLLDATALGVSRIIPVETAECRKKWWGEWEKHLPRFQRIMVVALKQSFSFFLPEISAPSSLAEAILNAQGFVIVADMNGIPLSVLPSIPSNRQISCFIGPPGGFNTNEMQLFEIKSYLRVRLAPARLRTELAATVLCGQLIAATL